MSSSNVAEEKDIISNKENVKSFAHLTYSAIYASDLQESAQWYYKAFGVQIVSINSDFATMEYAPGRIMFLERNPDYPRSLSFSTRNIEALRRQLILQKIDIEVDEGSYLKIKDPDGNTIEVRKTAPEYERVNISMPSQFVRDLIRCRLETREEMHVIAKQIHDDLEFQSVSAELLSICKQHGLNEAGEPFIVSRYSDKVEAVFACIAVDEPLVGQLADGAEYIQIPKYDYVVFPVSYDVVDKLRTDHFAGLAGFMSWSFTKPEESYYILEHYKDDFIYVHMPYYWDKGWQIHDSLMNQKGDEQHDQ
ncbi:VOC family protein [Paenibacillus thermotolerans]|uniref:VOC family protein n=1 Tax=Paenibacillus thermotolerans TaxID=3027807 RepID=UPI0023679097|nr:MULTISPECIES: VOC family protein [unclassified Paenibacillus]